MRLCDELETGEEVEVDMEKDVLTVLSTGKQYPLKSLGEVLIPSAAAICDHTSYISTTCASNNIILRG